MKTGQGCGLRPCHSPGIESGMCLNVCMENGGNGEDASPEGEWVMCVCQSM